MFIENSAIESNGEGGDVESVASSPSYSNEDDINLSQSKLRHTTTTRRPTRSLGRRQASLLMSSHQNAQSQRCPTNQPLSSAASSARSRQASIRLNSTICKRSFVPKKQRKPATSTASRASARFRVSTISTTTTVKFFLLPWFVLFIMYSNRLQPALTTIEHCRKRSRDTDFNSPDSDRWHYRKWLGLQLGEGDVVRYLRRAWETHASQLTIPPTLSIAQINEWANCGWRHGHVSSMILCFTDNRS